MTQPNILFILIDDMGWKDLACYGSEFYETPNTDRLAQEGMLFTDAYASCPVCSPTRASVMTGKYPATVGITDWIGGHSRGKLEHVPYLRQLPLSETCIGESLRDGGYQTWHVGKWHLGEEDPIRYGFDVNIGGCHMGSPAHGGFFSPWSIPVLDNTEVPDGTYLTDYLTDRAIELIENRDRTRPFFMNMCYYSVHIPIQAKDEHIERFRKKAQAMGIADVDPFEEGDFFPCEHKHDKRIKCRTIQSDPVYAAMIWSLDENIGRLLHALDETGADDTLVVFTSDNGGLATAEGSPTCNAPLAEGKGWMYEGATREPMLVRWPGKVEADSTCDVPVTTPDFYPTFLEAAGLPPKPEQHCDGVSLLSLFKGEGTPDRDAIFWHYPHYSNQGGTPGSSVRMDDYKLIEFFEDSHVELYNLREDIGETTDLSEQMPERTAMMQERLAEWRESIEAKIPSANPDWQKQ